MASPEDAGRLYDVSPDGRRFLISKDETRLEGAQIHVVLSWFEELRRLVPVN